MGLHRETGGYSASVEGYFVLNGERILLAKTNGSTFVLAEPRELDRNTTGELLIIVDGEADSKLVVVPSGAIRGQTQVEYKVIAPF